MCAEAEPPDRELWLGVDTNASPYTSASPSDASPLASDLAPDPLLSSEDLLGLELSSDAALTASRGLCASVPQMAWASTSAERARFAGGTVARRRPILVGACRLRSTPPAWVAGSGWWSFSTGLEGGVKVRVPGVPCAMPQDASSWCKEQRQAVEEMQKLDVSPSRLHLPRMESPLQAAAPTGAPWARGPEVAWFRRDIPNEKAGTPKPACVDTGKLMAGVNAYQTTREFDAKLLSTVAASLKVSTRSAAIPRTR